MNINAIRTHPPAPPPMVYDGQIYPMRYLGMSAGPECIIISVKCYEWPEYTCRVDVPFSYDEEIGNAEEMKLEAFRRADMVYHALVTKRNQRAKDYDDWRHSRKAA